MSLLFATYGAISERNTVKSNSSLQRSVVSGFAGHKKEKKVGLYAPSVCFRCANEFFEPFRYMFHKHRRTNLDSLHSLSHWLHFTSLYNYSNRALRRSNRNAVRNVLRNALRNTLRTATCNALRNLLPNTPSNADRNVLLKLRYINSGKVKPQFLFFKQKLNHILNWKD